MYTIKVEHSFDSAHFLADYVGKCSNIHGHRWRVEVEIESESLIQDGQLKGMITDFSVVKRDVREMLDFYDHALIIEKGAMREETLRCLKEDGFRIIEVCFRPTAENFAYFFFNEVQGRGYGTRRVTVYETPSNSACYER